MVLSISHFNSTINLGLDYDAVHEDYILLTSIILSDEYRILVDMRWNKQYLDILASKCNFEDEERYMDFLEALNTVANRYSCSLHS